jgi:hypothetical protein
MRIYLNLGGELARFSRRYFFSGALLAMAIVSAYAYAQFPYGKKHLYGRSIVAKPRDQLTLQSFSDNLCKPDVPKTGYANQEFIGVLLLSGDTIVRIEEEQDEAVVLQSKLARIDSGIFSPPPVFTSRVQLMSASI